MLQAPCENGSPITKYNLEWDEGKGDGKFCEIYSGLQKQFKVTHKLPPGTPCVFRLKAVNDIGARFVFDGLEDFVLDHLYSITCTVHVGRYLSRTLTIYLPVKTQSYLFLKQKKYFVVFFRWFKSLNE